MTSFNKGCLNILCFPCLLVIDHLLHTVCQLNVPSARRHSMMSLHIRNLCLCGPGCIVGRHSISCEVHTQNKCGWYSVVLKGRMFAKWFCLFVEYVVSMRWGRLDRWSCRIVQESVWWHLIKALWYGGLAVCVVLMYLHGCWMRSTDSESSQQAINEVIHESENS